ncbi:SAM-dependent methyltransferase [Tsukamurella paurometabola]
MTKFFDGLELLEPGVVSCNRWRRTPTAPSHQPRSPCSGGVARKA